MGAVENAPQYEYAMDLLAAGAESQSEGTTGRNLDAALLAHDMAKTIQDSQDSFKEWYLKEKDKWNDSLKVTCEENGCDQPPGLRCVNSTTGSLRSEAHWGRWMKGQRLAAIKKMSS